MKFRSCGICGRNATIFSLEDSLSTIVEYVGVDELGIRNCLSLYDSIFMDRLIKLTIEV